MNSLCNFFFFKISFAKVGMSAKSGPSPRLGQVLTLGDAVKSMGDAGKTISYLKVDIEGSELESIPEWISSGILDRVSQFGIELHTGRTALGSDQMAKLLDLLDVWRNLHELGFRMISNTNNDCVGKSDDLQNQYFNLFEVVFYKAA